MKISFIKLHSIYFILDGCDSKYYFKKDYCFRRIILDTSYKYKFIENLTEDWIKLQSQELTSLSPIWLEQSRKLEQSESLQIFNTKLSREWAIETGIIENLYTLDRGITQLLIEKGFESSLIPHGSSNKNADEVISILKDQETALEGLFQLVNQTRGLTVSYIKELHQVITNSQHTVQAKDSLGNYGEVALEKGIWKIHPNNPTRNDGKIHEYCPPEHVASEMDNLITMYEENIKNGISPEVLSAWLHHRFTQIHPFQDGNGRVARAIASLVFIQNRWFPLVINRDHRTEYIDALEKADNGDLKELVDLFARLQKKAFLKALSLSEQILKKDESMHMVISSAIDKIKERKTTEHTKLQTAFEFGNKLSVNIQQNLNDISSKLNGYLKSIDDHYFTDVDFSNKTNDYWFRYQIIGIANKIDYFADTRTYRKWIRLKLYEERKSEIIFSIHSLGTEFLGILAISGFIYFKDSSEESNDLSSETHQICSEVFQFSYNEEFNNIEKRFNPWIEKATLSALEEWRRQI